MTLSTMLATGSDEIVGHLKMSTEEKLKHILDLGERHSHPSDPGVGPDKLAYAMIAALDDSELIDFYFDQVSSSLAPLMKGAIRKRLEEGADGFQNFISKLIKVISKADYHGSYRRLRSHLKYFIPVLSSADLSTVFDHFLDSHRKTDRRLAVMSARSIWNGRVEARLWETWQKWEGEYVIELLAEQGEVSDLANAIKDIWEADIDVVVKRKCARAVAQHDLEAVGFIESINPITYFHLKLISGSEVTEEEARNYLASVSDNRELGFAIYLLGQAGQWDLLLGIKEELFNLDSN